MSHMLRLIALSADAPRDIGHCIGCIRSHSALKHKESQTNMALAGAGRLPTFGLLQLRDSDSLSQLPPSHKQITNLSLIASLTLSLAITRAQTLQDG